MTYHSPLDQGVPYRDFDDGDESVENKIAPDTGRFVTRTLRWPSRRLAVVLALVALLAIAAPLALLWYQPAARPTPRVPAPGRVVPQAEVPAIEPVEYREVTPDDARSINAATAFSTAPNPAARPFRFAGSSEQRGRAVDCLAAAMYYEAGDEAVGERAVGQVVLNRVRHPAFPKTVCGVVFQGQERATGCQFTFTCDGAMARAIPPAGWDRARKLAEAALSGNVMAKVGQATHYHTDWVVPYWSASLDKITAVGTHLFFRWTGWWGTPGAFRSAVDPAEPVIAKLAALSPAHALPAGLADLDPASPATLAANDAVIAAIQSDRTSGAPVQSMSARDAGTFLITLDHNAPADQLPALAQRTCGARDYCKLLAWTVKTGSPAMLPLTAKQMAAMAFSYLRDTSAKFEKPLWNCAIFKRDDPQQCMKAVPPAARPAPAASPSALRPQLGQGGVLTPTVSMLTPQTAPAGAP